MSTTPETNATVLREALEAVLAELEAPAALLCARKEVRCANEAWRGLPESTLLGLRRRADALTDPVDGLRTIPLPSGGPTMAYLVIGSPECQDASRKAALLGPTWGLTGRQVQVLAELARGRSNKEVAALLGIVEGTVECHLTLMFRRTGCASRAELLALFWGARP